MAANFTKSHFMRQARALGLKVDGSWSTAMLREAILSATQAKAVAGKS